MPTRCADDAELELAGGNALDQRLRIRNGQCDLHPGVSPLELTEKERHDDRGGAGRGPELELAPELALALTGELVEELLFQREQPLRAPLEPQSCLGRLDTTARAVEQLCAEPLLEGANLQRDGGLCDTEPLGRLREAPALDHRTERGKLTRIHKDIL
jgi:hypothetical protein